MTAVEWIFEELEDKENGLPHLTLEQIYKQAKKMEKQQKGYSEEDLIKFVSFTSKNYIKAKGFYYMKGDFEKSMKVSIHQILEQFKKK